MKKKILIVFVFILFLLIGLEVLNAVISVRDSKKVSKIEIGTLDGNITVNTEKLFNNEITQKSKNENLESIEDEKEETKIEKVNKETNIKKTESEQKKIENKVTKNAKEKVNNEKINVKPNSNTVQNNVIKSKENEKESKQPVETNIENVKNEKTQDATKPKTNIDNKPKCNHTGENWFDTNEQAEAKVDTVFKYWNDKYYNGDITWEELVKKCPSRI